MNEDEFSFPSVCDGMWMDVDPSVVILPSPTDVVSDSIVIRFFPFFLLLFADGVFETILREGEGSEVWSRESECAEMGSCPADTI